MKSLRTRAIFAVAAACGVASACFVGPTESVHFHSQSPDFGVPPARASMSWWKWSPDRPGQVNAAFIDARYWEKEDDPYDPLRFPDGLNPMDDPAEAAEVLRSLKDESNHPGAIQDRIEVYEQLAETGDDAGVAAYLRAREVYDLDELADAEERMLALSAADHAEWLEPHIDYVLAAIAYEQGDYRTAATQWRQLAEVHRDSPRAESALIMAARSLLGEAYRETVPWNHPVEEPLEIIEDLLVRYPDTRFRDNALGWRARAYHLQNDNNEANQIYYNLLERAEDPDWKWTLHGSLAETTLFQSGEDIYHRLHQLALPVSLEKRIGVIHKLNQRFRWIQLQEAVELQQRLLGDHVALASYLEFRLNYTYLTPLEFKQLMLLAEEAYNQNGGDMLNARVLARVAETAYMDADAEKAEMYAREALAKPGDEGKDLALYVLGSSARLSGEPGEAETHYREMIESYPESHLVGAAKENLALVHEAQGDYREALDVYYDLGYDLDVAYLVDAFLSLGELERYIEQNPAHPQFNVLVYSLGIRLMRQERFDDALETFERIPEDRLLEIGRVGDQFGFWNQDPELDIIRDPRVTARDLKELHKQVESAGNNAAKADALYELASYHYELRNLLLYNPALWQGSRSFSFGYFYNPDASDERGLEAVVEHHHEHEDVYQTLQICQRIAEEYPNTEAAPKALYRGACAARRLAEFNPWWRDYDAENDLYGLAVEMMEALVERYPDSYLASDAEKYAEVFEEEREMVRRYRVFDSEI